jgi:monoterpene epsilon-lactone hydrolase
MVYKRILTTDELERPVSAHDRLDADGTLHLGPRTIPLPSSISAAARQMLMVPRAHAIVYPASDDVKGWSRWRAQTDAAIQPFAEQILQLAEGRATVETTVIDGVTVHVGRPTTMPDENGDRAWIYIHGGGFVCNGGTFARALGALYAAEWQCSTYSVDYRLAPEDPFPAAIDDVLAVYRSLLASYGPRNIVIAGQSSGGNAAAATALRARDEGLPLPAALVLETPACDLTQSGDTFNTLAGVDPNLPGASPEMLGAYAGGHDLRDPYLSPLYGDFAPGFPPTFIRSGTRDLLLSSAVQLHRALRRALVDAELHIWEAAPHRGFALGKTPEGVEQHDEIARFLSKRWGTAPQGQ